MSVVDKVTKGRVVHITLNRPDVLNALGPEMASGLHDALTEVKNQSDIRCVVLRGAGKGFMAGGDIGFFQSSLTDLQAGKTDGIHPIFEQVHGIVSTLQALTVPVIAAVHGPVAGFGVSLVAACDLAIAAKSTQFTLAYCHIGACPDGGSTYFLPRIVGLRKSMELALFGARFNADEALSMGLVNRVVPDEKLEETISEWSMRLTRGPRTAYRKTKQLLYASLDNCLEDQLDLEAAGFLECAKTEDFAEGVNAFLGKRKPDFEA